MNASGSESPLSEAPSPASPARSIGTDSPAKPPPAIKLKETQKKKSQTESASSSRRSSRIEDRSVSPEKPAASKTSLKFKITRPPSPEKLSEIAEEAKAEVEVEEKGKRGKKRKSESWTEAEGEVREAIGKGKGKKKVKVSHGHVEDEEEPKKKNVAIVKKSSGGVGEKSATDMISDLFGDEDEEEEEEVVKDKKEVVKPLIKIKGKSGRKPKIEQDVDGDVTMDYDEAVVEKTPKSSKSTSKARRHEQVEVKPETETTIAPSKSTSKRTKRETADDVTIPDEPATEISAVKAPSKPKGRPKKAVEAEAPPTSTTTSASTIKENKLVEPATAPELDTDPTRDDPKSTPAIEKPKKSFAQVVAGSPPQEKRERKPLPTITKLNKSMAGSTPDKRISSNGSGTGTNTPTAKKLPPPQKKKEVSLLESTMASLLGGGPKSTPKKEVRLSYLTSRRRVADA
jgi:hypothetical protein